MIKIITITCKSTGIHRRNVSYGAIAETNTKEISVHNSGIKDALISAKTISAESSLCTISN